MRALALFACAVLIAIGACEMLARELIVVRDLGPSFSERDPMLGKVHKKRFSTVRRTPEFTMRFTTNSVGYRGPEPAPFDDDAEPVVLCLGDSFTEGFGVDDGEEFPRLLDAALTAEGEHVRTINAGVGDTATGRALRFLRAYGATADGAHPTVLVYQVAGNDFSDNEEEAFFTLAPDGTLRERTGDAPTSALRRVQPVIESIPGLSYSYLFGAVTQALKSGGTRHATAEGVSGTRGVELTLRLEDALLGYAEQRGWSTIVVGAGLSGDEARLLTPTFAAHNVEWLQIPSKLERPDLYYRIDGHWTAAGHAYVAARLLPDVTQLLATTGRKHLD